MTEKMGGGCIELVRDAAWSNPPHCCGLCHDDEDAGYSQPRETIFNGRMYWTCCAIDTAFEKLRADAGTREEER